MLYKGSMSPGHKDLNYKLIDRKLIVPKLPKWERPADPNADPDAEGGKAKQQKK